MDNEEAASVLAVMSAAWPKNDLPDESVQLWAKFFEGVDFWDAQDAANWLVLNSEWFPSIAVFRQTLSRVVERRRLEQNALPISLDPMNEKQYRKFLKMCREAMRKPDGRLQDVSPTNEPPLG